MASLILSSILFSLSFGLIGAQLRGVDPYLVSFIRLGLSFGVFLPFARKTRLAWRLMGIGALEFGLMYCLYIQSYRFLQGHEVALLTATTPIYAVLLGSWLEKRWKWRYLGGALLAAAGALVSLRRGGGGVAGIGYEFALAGALLVQASNLCFAAGQMLYREAVGDASGHRHHFAWLYLGAMLVPPAFLWATHGNPLAAPTPVRPIQWLSLLYLGLIPSGLGLFLWNRGVARTSAPVAAVMNNFKAPLGMMLAWLVFGEQVQAGRVLTGAALIGAALALSADGPRGAGRAQKRQSA